MIAPVQYDLNVNKFLNKVQTNKHFLISNNLISNFSKKVQKILISLVTVHFCFYYIIRPIYTFFIF